MKSEPTDANSVINNLIKKGSISFVTGIDAIDNIILPMITVACQQSYCKCSDYEEIDDLEFIIKASSARDDNWQYACFHCSVIRFFRDIIKQRSVDVSQLLLIDDIKANKRLKDLVSKFEGSIKAEVRADISIMKDVIRKGGEI